MVRIGEYLINEKYISGEQLQEGLSRQKETGELIGLSLIKLGFISEEKIKEALLDYRRKYSTFK